MGCVGCPSCDVCPSCCVTSTPCPGGSWCAAFFTQVLAGLGAPLGANNLGMLLAWSGGEGTGAGWNPLATTEVFGTYSWWNCAPHWVKCYASEADGVGATVATLENGHYPTIVQALREDWDRCRWQCSPALVAELGVWGTGAGWLGARTGSCGGSPPPPDPCAGVSCPACSSCSGGACVAVTCPAGQACDTTTGQCVAVPGPVGGGNGAVLAVVLGTVAAGIGVVLWRSPAARGEAARKTAIVERTLRPAAVPAFGAHAGEWRTGFG